MARETLPVAVNSCSDEGGCSNRKSDRAGPTKYGVTHTNGAPRREIVKSVTARLRCIRFGLNSGPYRAVNALQKVVGVREDGQVGV